MKIRTFALALACIAGAALSHAAAAANYRCGGIGSDEAQQMKSEAAGHDMMLTFASTTGAYVADVDVDIRDAKGASALAVKCKGPIMWVDVPAAGDYRVNAQFNGTAREQTLHVAKGGKAASATFTWPAE